MARLFVSLRPRSRILHHLHTAISQSASSIQLPRTRLDEHFHLEIPSRSGRERIPGHALVQLAIACRAPAVPVLPCRELVHHVGWTASSATLRPALWKSAAGNSNRSTLRVQLSSVGLHAAILHVLLLLLSIRRLPRCCYSARLSSIARARLWRASRRPRRAAGSRYLCVLLPTHGPPAAAIRLRTRLLALIQIPVGLFECISQQESLRTETEQTGHADSETTALFSISAAFRERSEWNSLFAFLAATRYLLRHCRARLPLFRRLQRHVQHFPQS